jgi:hypothetical protein
VEARCGQEEEERTFIKIHDSSGKPSVKRYSRKPTAGTPDSCRK